mmetsp:Transcript_83942/g.166621  ORF Transcript_83942/g.166621 Transcript_83942/m.166621 type:complete len:278 (-) Transcript_83942:94-927(-)|eukprot:CAMPEP_0172720654 /NCGR_PEP_ID=MMETSP1074-20121228/77373_1 /TAXON_ID=2916 /ORGANISM="Ceratium fusus, Strain PA161109" /LENGTH=277 /DNA_ID=CAMNT_0013546213 /DNA_START=102 /DNA_END=935 /DNA_ORIENTATION=+
MAKGAGDEDQKMEVMSAIFPDAEQAELLRFVRARPKSHMEAMKMYQEHLQWRAGPGLPANLASAIAGVSPKWVQRSGVARDGTTAIYVCGGAYSSDIGPELHVLALCHAIDEAFAPSDGNKCSAFIDTRPKKGLDNVPAQKMLPLFQMCSSVLQANYPERLERLLVYPMPKVVNVLWNNVIKPFMDSKTADKVKLFSGNSGHGTPAPEKLNDFVDVRNLPQEQWYDHKELWPLADEPLSAAEVENIGKPAEVDDAGKPAEADESSKPGDDAELPEKQ